MICSNCQGIIQKDVKQCFTCGTNLHTDCTNNCVKCGNFLCDKCSLDNQFKCKACNADVKHEMEFISSTMFESFLKCPHLFKHEFILKTFSEEEKQNKYSAIGTMLHNLFDVHSQTRPIDVKQLNNDYNKAFNAIPIELFNDEDDKKTFKTMHLETLKNWYNTEHKVAKPLYTEKQHFVDIHPELPKIRVTIDRINGVENNVAQWDVVDYKTGKVYVGEALERNMQFPIYAMAIKHLYGQAPRSLTFYFPQHQAHRIFERITDDVYVCKVKRGGTYSFSLTQRLEQMIGIYKQIQQGNMKPKTNNSHFCNNFCPLGKQNMCDGLTKKWT